MSIGPVEPHRGPPGAREGTTVEVSGPNRRGRHGRWREPLGVAAVAAALVLGPLLLYDLLPDPDPPPYPGPLTHLVYDGPDGPPDPAARTFALRITITVDAGPPVTLESIAQPHRALETGVRPGTPFTVRAHRHRSAVLTVRIRTCSDLPKRFEQASLDVTLRNKGAMLIQAYSLGDRYDADLSRAVRALCPTP
ncbi:hypothetical protein ABT160_11215 [Streptomyces sp. NPDC001941]|uniref:hypothetical protein n=1 Tax=Streptomyces sp. NPDC001941 TaxID=3154659 RepID=UPI00332ECE9D